MSDRGMPAGYRHMHGFGSHTFSFINAANERFWVKFHFVCQQGIKNLTDAEATPWSATTAKAPARPVRSIERKTFPKWKLCVQSCRKKTRLRCRYNPFDLTKVWPHGDYPLIEVGEWS
jgi:catalase